MRIGEMQVQALGIDVDVVNPETGASMRNTRQPGEMIVQKSFHSMSACFWATRT
jgi:acetoacetyl-CoA synthetase